jgi:hypothetical protein
MQQDADALRSAGRRGLIPTIDPRAPMKLEEIRVESFSTTDGEVAMMPTGTWMDATAGCCAPPPPATEPYINCGTVLTKCFPYE